MINTLFNMIENIIKDVTLEGFNLYEIMTPSEKLSVSEKNFISYKILKHNVLLRYFKMKKVEDCIEIRIINPKMLNSIENKFDKIKFKEDEGYARISIHNIDEINKLSTELKELFKYLFLQYLKTEESFGCCSKYIQCSDNLACVQKDLRLRLSCIYKTNLENNKIFYGKNKNIQ